MTRFVVGVDIKGYSTRNTRVQQAMRAELTTLVADAAEAVGLGVVEWELFDTGDGKLAVLPPDIDLAVVVGRFVDELDARLVERNEDRAPATRMQLRVAMHSDGIVASPPGYAGPALVVLSRYLDSPPVREAIDRAPGAGLALIVSEVVYRMVVEAGLGHLRPDRFRHVSVDIPSKSFSASGYVYVPGHDVSGVGPFDDDRDAPEEPTPSRRPGPVPPGPPGGAASGFTIGTLQALGDANLIQGDYVRGESSQERDR